MSRRPHLRRRYAAAAVAGVLAVAAGSALAATTGSLTPAGCIGAPGTSPASCSTPANLNAANSVTVSPDGHTVYTTSFKDAAVEVFTRAANGALTPAGCLGNNGSGPGNCTGVDGLSNPISLAVSPDGQNAYVAASFSSDLVLLARRSDGALISMGCIGDVHFGPASCTTQANLNGADGVAVSPDGHTVYVVSASSNAIEVMARAANGTLTPSGCIGNNGTGPGNCTGADGLVTPVHVVVSPDGNNVYVVSVGSDALVMFARRADGALTSMGCVGDFTKGPASCTTHANLQGPRSVAVSPDGHNVYVASESSRAIEVFNRAADGSLTPAGCLGNNGNGPGNCTGVDGIDGVDSVAVSPDGQNVYATGSVSNTVVVLTRRSDGALFAAGCIGNTGTGPASCNATDGLSSADGVAVSPDGGNVYAIAALSNTLVTFNRAVPGGSGNGGNGNGGGSGGTGGSGSGGTGGSGGSGSGPGSSGGGPSFTHVLRTSHSRFRIGNSGHKRHIPVGTSFSFALSENASVTITFLQAHSGRRVSGSCVKPSSQNARRSRCTRYVVVGSIKATGHKGANHVAFSGNLSGLALPPGKYRASAVATDSSKKTSQASTASFTVVS